MLLFLLTLCAAEHWSIKLNADADPRQFALEHNVRYIKTLFGYSVFESNEHTSNLFFATPGLHKDTKKRQRKRYDTRTTDPLFAQQWHLHQLGIDQVTQTGRGVTIGIVDDGLEVTHPDLAANVDLEHSYDFNHHSKNVMPYPEDGHGTSAAGVCCAARNNFCGRGAAPEAKIAGIKLIAEPAYDYQEAEALTFHKDRIRIYSNSWGPEDSGQHMAEPGRITKSALKEASKKNIYVWAGGNGRQSLDNANYDGYANSPYTIAIGAVDYRGQPAWYSEPGACLFAVAPSSGNAHGITTTDLTGRHGYDRGDCTNQFGGTSSAAPLAAGIFALMLEVNPHLTQRDIQHIIVKQSKTGHSHDYGFGVLQIPPLLEETMRHQLVPELKVIKSEMVRFNRAIPDDGSWLEETITVPHHLQVVEQVAVTVHMMHDYHGQVLVEMNDSILAAEREDFHSGPSLWTYTTVREWGKQTRDFKFRIRDSKNDNKTGMLITVSLAIFGY